MGDRNKATPDQRRHCPTIAEALVVFTESMFGAKRPRMPPVSCAEFELVAAKERGNLSLHGMRDLRGSMTGHVAVSIAV
jgi:hypothetical protein